MNLSGVLVVNKPLAMTSHDVIDRLRKILHTRRIGHAGTLDPNAEGILLACVNNATKVAQFLTEHDKEYEAVIKLGTSTDTYDGNGKIIKTEKDLKINPERIKEAILSFKGKIWQIPPLYSAIKYKGKKLYQYARAKEKVDRKKREVEIKDIKIQSINIPYVELKIKCSKGTYVRSLAHDLGEKLGCGAYLYSLRRTQVGPFRLNKALSLESISEAQSEGRIQEILVAIEEALSHLPSVVVKEGFAQRVQHGVPLESASVMSTEGGFDQNQIISLKDGQRKIIAIGKALSSAKNFVNLNYEDKLFEYIRVL